MPIGKLISQAAHAYLESYLTSDKQQEYRADGIGTKVTLQSKSLDDLFRAQYECERRGIPCALIEDSGHVMPPHFDGSPIVTALGIGPARRNEVKSITKRFKLL